MFYSKNVLSVILRTWRCTTSSPSVTPSPSSAESTGWHRRKPRHAWISSLTSWIYLRSRVWFEIWGKTACGRRAAWVWQCVCVCVGGAPCIVAPDCLCKHWELATGQLWTTLLSICQWDIKTVAQWKKNQRWNRRTGFTDVTVGSGVVFTTSHNQYIFTADRCVWTFTPE